MKFNNSQECAILHKDGAMLVLAGPGSGKTAVITHRAYNLIEKYKVDPKEILVITFTKAAANEMKERFIKLCNGKDYRVSFGTFHAVFFTILKSAYNLSGTNIVSDEQRFGFMREIIYRHNLDYKDENDFISALFAEISMIKNSRIDIEHFYSSQCGAEIFREIYKEYNNYLKRSRLLDFDDMLLYT